MVNERYDRARELDNDAMGNDDYYPPNLAYCGNCNQRRYFKNGKCEFCDLDPVSELLAAAKDAVESLSRLQDVEGAYRVTAIQQLRNAIKKIEKWNIGGCGESKTLLCTVWET